MTDSPGKAWVWNKSKKKWVKPKQPANNNDTTYTWDDTKGWIPTTKAQEANTFGLALSVIAADKTGSLSALFDSAWKDFQAGKEWDKDYFKLKLKDTAWFNAHSANQQDFFLIENDPTRKAELDDRLAKAEKRLRAVGDQMGATIDDATYKDIARQSVMDNWEEPDIRNAIAGHLAYSSAGSLGGTAGGLEDQIRNYAASMGVDVTDQWVMQQVQQQSASGANEINAAQDFIRARAKEKYSMWANDLNDANVTIEDLSYNYRTAMANMFEISPDEVDMNNPTIKQAMQIGDGNGNKMTSFQFEQLLRKDPRWAKTKNAKEETNTVVNNVLSTFGLV